MAGGGAVLRRSGLQREVLTLYKDALKAAKSKAQNDPQAAAASLQTVRSAFRKNLDIPRTDFRLIESLVRMGQRKVKLLGDANVQQAKVFTVKR
mmetsp:Transcript_1360/g.2163  ORF Transcript_1360/g.2163 Transcript_1360/m.2163 type:complete len:94 (-) Transcript_1360:1887-2168(-)